jgi:hypothetical protein
MSLGDQLCKRGLSASAGCEGGGTVATATLDSIAIEAAATALERLRSIFDSRTLLTSAS